MFDDVETSPIPSTVTPRGYYVNGPAAIAGRARLGEDDAELTDEEWALAKIDMALADDERPKKGAK